MGGGGAGWGVSRSAAAHPLLLPPTVVFAPVVVVPVVVVPVAVVVLVVAPLVAVVVPVVVVPAGFLLLLVIVPRLVGKQNKKISEPNRTRVPPR